MGKPVLNQIWTFLAVVLLYFSVNVWSATQQWQLSLPGNPFKDGKVTAHSVTLYGIPLCGALFVALLLVTRWHARAEPALLWTARFPKLANLDFNPYTAQARVAQTLSVFAFIVLPAGALVHFLLKFLQGTAYQANNKPWAAGLEHLTEWRGAFAGGYYYDRDATVARGPDFLPFWEPWLFMFWVVFVLGYAIYCLKPVFAPAGILNGRK
ncbi:MAG: hypothetical protein WBW33_09000 [Bryobacteraceae bacterium]